MARPLKTNVTKRTVRFPTTQCTPDELATVRRLANAARLPVTGYIRSVATGYEIKGDPSGVPPELILELRRIGNNINQAVKKFHQTGHPPSSIEQTAGRLDILIDGLIQKFL